MDWEFPSTTEQSAALTDLLSRLRAALDEAASKRENSKPHFVLTAALSAGDDNNRALEIPKIAQSLDYINLMNYDFSGAWSNLTANMANLHKSPGSPCSEAAGADSVFSYMHRGMPVGKILFDMPLYGKSFADTDGLNKPFNGTGNGSYDDPSGIWDLKALPRPGGQVIYEPVSHS